MTETEELQAIAAEMAKVCPIWMLPGCCTSDGLRIVEVRPQRKLLTVFATLADETIVVKNVLAEAIPDLSDIATRGALWDRWCPRGSVDYDEDGDKLWHAATCVPVRRKNSTIHDSRPVAMMRAVLAAMEAANGKAG